MESLALSFSRANLSRSLASFWALVTSVILIFFMSLVKLSMSLAVLSATGRSGDVLAGVPERGDVLETVRVPLTLVVLGSLLGALGARGVGSFLTGALVFLTASGVPTVALALIDESGLMVNDVPGRVPVLTGAVGGADTGLKLSDTRVDAALRRRPGCLGCLEGAEGPPTVLRLFLGSSSDSSSMDRAALALRSLRAIRVGARSDLGGTVPGG